MPTQHEIIAWSLEMLKTLAHDLANTGVTLKIIIPNSGGFDPDIMIVLTGPAFQEHQFDAEIKLFRLSGDEEQPNLHIDVQAANQRAELILDLHRDLEHFDEVKLYLDNVLSLFRSVL